MVISTMSALLIAAMAMYFSTVSSRSVQYAVFSEQQSYQSSVSIQNALIAGLKDGEFGDLMNALTSSSFDVGDSLSTNGNDFAAFGGTNEDEDQLGAYDVTITRIDDEVVSGVTNKTYDIAVTVSVNGVLDTTHYYIHVAPSGSSDGVGSTNIFASTGYVPNNSFLDGGTYYTTCTYDNEYVIIGANGARIHQEGDLYCGGSLDFNEWSHTVPDNAMTWVVRDTFYFNANNTLTLGPSSSDKGKLYIGGDLYINNNSNFENADVYVLGDVYVNINGSIGSSVTLHIDGDLIVTNNTSIVNLELNGTVDDQSGLSYLSFSYTEWDDDEANAAVDFIDACTATATFQKWEIDDSNYTSSSHITIEFNSGYLAYGSLEAELSTVEIPWGGGTETYTYIDDIVDRNNNDVQFSDYTIFIDTGDDPENIHYIYAAANLDVDGDEVDESFSWQPEKDGSPVGRVNVLTTGKGSVVIDIPEGVTYLASNQEKIMNYGWFLILGGEVSGSGSTALYSYNTGTIWSYEASRILSLMHTDCDDGCSDCNYVVSTSTEKCSECNEFMTNIVCENHGLDRDYCMNTECSMYNEPDKNDSGDYYGLCESRIDRSKVDSFLNANPSIASIYPTDSNGDYIYPNCNIFVVSCDESAEIYISNHCVGDTEVGLTDNRFFGFIYAPYMTFKGKGSSGQGVRFCGGMIVSDYILDDYYGYVNCYPDFMPSELGANQGALSGDSKAWKITVARN